MIIKYPTGFYVDVLPMNLNEAGNITFTVSDTRPPRSELIFPQIPTGLYYRKRPSPRPDTYVGKPIFYISNANNPTLNNSAQQFEVGQYLDENTPIAYNLTDINVNSPYTSTHNLNLFDYDSMGLNGAEINSIDSNSKKIFYDLNIKLNSLKAAVGSDDLNINKLQKQLNETSKTIDAVKVMITNTSDIAVKEQLTTTLENLQRSYDLTTEQMALLVAKREEKAVQVMAISDELNNLAVVVR